MIKTRKRFDVKNKNVDEDLEEPKLILTKPKWKMNIQSKLANRAEEGDNIYY